MTVGTKTMLAGTPGFQSPEQLKAESVGIPSNVYAFGGTPEWASFVWLVSETLKNIYNTYPTLADSKVLHPCVLLCETTIMP